MKFEVGPGLGHTIADFGLRILDFGAARDAFVEALREFDCNDFSDAKEQKTAMLVGCRLIAFTFAHR